MGKALAGLEAGVAKTADMMRVRSLERFAAPQLEHGFDFELPTH
jgi:hypothetical protein